MLGLRVFEFLREFQPGTHVLFLYDGQEAKRELLFSHLRYARSTEGIAYVCSEESPNSIRQGLKDFGVSGTTLKGDNDLTVSNYDEIYIVNDKVVIPQIISKFAKLVGDCKARGMNGLRVSAEMSCFFEHRKVDELIDFEVALHKKFDFDAEGICAYNISQMAALGYLDILMPLVRAHDPVIFSGNEGFLLLKSEKVRMKHAETLLSKIVIKE
jgi:hypothetical protein